MRPVLKRGPWWVLCDNESFLRTKQSIAANRANRIKLWKLPAKSPDLNPIERFWAWLRKELLRRDLADLAARRAVLGKFAYKQRVQGILRSKKAQEVAANIAGGLRKVCKLVIKKKGAASGK